LDHFGDLPQLTTLPDAYILYSMIEAIELTVWIISEFSLVLTVLTLPFVFVILLLYAWDKELPPVTVNKGSNSRKHSRLKNE